MLAILLVSLQRNYHHVLLLLLSYYVERSNTVRDLKTELQKVFPGHPPASLQRLFRGTQHLNDDVVLEDIIEHEEVERQF